MKWKVLAYLLLVTATIAGAAAVIGTVYRQGSTAVPRWPDLVRPGELSARHAFLSGKCETCHAPLRGVEASACIACHATDAVTLARQSTAFHSTIQSCAACHVEHQNAVRPTRMDHDALIAIGRARRLEQAGRPADAQWLSSLLNKSPADPEKLDCFGCHSNRSPHRDLFGQECAACHVTATWRIAGFQHPSPSSTECAQCHQAPPSHYMHHFHMISMMVAGHHHARKRRLEPTFFCAE